MGGNGKLFAAQANFFVETVKKKKNGFQEKKGKGKDGTLSVFQEGKKVTPQLVKGRGGETVTPAGLQGKKCGLHPGLKKESDKQQPSILFRYQSKREYHESRCPKRKELGTLPLIQPPKQYRLKPAERGGGKSRSIPNLHNREGGRTRKLRLRQWKRGKRAKIPFNGRTRNLSRK